MKTKRYSLLRKTVCTGIAALFLCSAPVAMAKTIKFNANVFFEEPVPMAGGGYGEWAKILKEESNGTLLAKVFYGGVLAPPKAGLTAVSDGLAEIGYHAAMYTPSDLPASNLLHELSSNFTDDLAMMGALTEYNFTNSELKEQYAKWDIFFGGAYSTPEYVMFCKDKISTPEEMKGQKVRTLGAGSAMLIEQLGGIPVNVPSTEMYSGLEKGILDCAANAVNDLKARSLWDVSKHTTLMSLGINYVGPQWGVRTSFWEDLDKSQREALLKSFARTMPIIYKYYKKSCDDAVSEAADHDVTFHKPDAKMQAIISDFQKNNIARAIAVGKEKNMVKDPESFIMNFITVYDRWVKLLEGVDRSDNDAVAKIMMDEIYSKVDVEKFPN